MSGSPAPVPGRIIRERALGHAALIGVAVWVMAFIVLRATVPAFVAIPGTLARVGLFLGLLAMTVYYALRRGGGPERWVALGLLAQTVMDPLIEHVAPARFTEFDPIRTVLDAILAIYVIGIALAANRYWTMLAAAFVTAPLVFHGFAYLRPMPPLAYAVLSIAWAYPPMLVTMIGTFRHGLRLEAAGADRSWTGPARENRFR